MSYITLGKLLNSLDRISRNLASISNFTANVLTNSSAMTVARGLPPLKGAVRIKLVNAGKELKILSDIQQALDNTLILLENYSQVFCFYIGKSQQHHN